MNKKRGLAIFGLIFVGMFLFFSGFVSATVSSCSVTSASSCSSSGGLVVMKLSGVTDAHGELASQSNYNTVLCCAINAGETTTCTSTNTVLRLSSTTNAHAEIPSNSNYANRVCLGGLTCTSASGSCPTSYPLQMLSLSGTTNAHLGAFADYSTKICCANSVPAYCNDITMSNYTYSASFPEDVDYKGANGYPDIKKEFIPGISSNATTSLADHCQSSSVLIEYYCATSNTILKETFTCPTGSVCDNGGCVYLDTCSDTDGGLNYEQFGIVTGTSPAYTYSPVIRNDSCDSETMVSENYCSGNVMSNVHHVCPERCENGACVSSTTPSSAYWADEYGYPIDTSQTQSLFIGDKLKLYATGLTPGATAIFEIYESDAPLGSDDIRVGGAALSSTVQSSGIASALWTITTADRDNALSQDVNEPFEFYFRVNDDFNSAQLSVSLGEASPEQCLGVVSCADYTQSQCGTDVCNVGNSGPLGDQCGVTTINNETLCSETPVCGCSWNSTSSVCGSSWEVEVKCGCGNGITESGEECDDGNTISGDGCSSTCELEGIYGDCPEGTTLCEDYTCSINCPVTDDDYSACNYDGTCDSNEGCTCDDCDNKVDSCDPDYNLKCAIEDSYCCDTESDGFCNPQCAFSDPDCGDGFSVCGNGIRETGELCDLGYLNGLSGTGCKIDCTYEIISSGLCPEGTARCSDGTCSVNCFDTDKGYGSCISSSCCKAGLNYSIIDNACCDLVSDNFCNYYCGSVDPDCVSSGESLTIGKCTYADSLSDDCGDGWLDRQLIASWAYSIDNKFSTNPNPSSSDYVQDSLGWHYDPIGLDGMRNSQRCQSITDRLACPAQIKVPFFGTVQLIIAIAILVIIYFIIKSKTEIKIKSRKRHSKK